MRTLFLFWVLIFQWGFIPSLMAEHWVHIDPYKPRSQKSAVLLMNGFGGSKAGCLAQMNYWRQQGMDVYIPDVLKRKSIAVSSDAMRAFVQEYELNEYKSIHAICYIAGSFLLHTYLQEAEMPNLKTIVYDRSPTQERAPEAVMNRIPFLGVVAMGRVLEDLALAEWPEPPDGAVVNKGLIIENRATALMRLLQSEALDMGPLVYDWRTIDPSAKDAFHVALDHNMMYERWDLLGPPVLHFIEHGRFPADLPRERIHQRPFDASIPLPE